MQTRRDFLKIAGMVTAVTALLSWGITDPEFLALCDAIDVRKARV
jgi:hypothetical protein